jgi:hypothetical protein
MSKWGMSFAWAGLALMGSASAPLLRAQYAAPPQQYTVTQMDAMMGGASTVKVYRDGSKALVERPDGNPPMREYVDLASKRTVSWNLKDQSACATGTFGGDWGDPFASSAEMNADLAKQHAASLGAENVNGFATKIFEAQIDGGGKARAWIDTKYGLIIKLQMAGNTILETKAASFAKPPADVFTVPAGCGAALSAPAPPTEAERIAAETGEPAANFANAMMPPSARAGLCAVVVKVYKAGSMTPVTSGFQLALDSTIDPNNMPHYTIGQSVEGHLTFSGGGLKDMTSQLQQGALRIDNAPRAFYLDAGFGKGGESSALIYRQCSGPQSVLLLVVKNPQQLSDGMDWLWAKTGKYAK